MKRRLVFFPFRSFTRGAAIYSPFSSSKFSTAHEIESRIAVLQQGTRVCLSQNKFASALEHATACFESCEVHFGREHVATACALNNLGQVHRQRGDLKSSLPFMVDALEVYEKISGPEHLSTGQALGNLGLLLVALAQKSKGVERLEHVEEARGHLERALECKRKALGERHAQVGVAMYQLASALRLQKKFIEAEKLLVSSVTLLREAEQKNGPLTATATNNLGFLYKERGDFSRARACYEEALSVRQNLLGERHPDSVATKHNLAECLRASGDEEGAQRIQREIMQLFPSLVKEASEAELQGVGASAAATSR